MKVFVLLAIICLGTALALPDSRELKQEIFNRFFVKLGAKHGYKLGLNSRPLSDARFPVLPALPLPDPLPIPDWSFELPDNDITVELEASLANGALEGLTSWTDDLKLNILTQRVIYSADIKSVKLTGDYTGRCEVNFIIPIFPFSASGNGELFANIDGSHFDVGFNLAVNLTTTRVYVKNVALNLRFDKASMFLENAKYMGYDVSWDVLNGQMKPVFDETWAALKPSSEQLLTEVLNEIVGQYTLAEIIEFIINIGKPKP